MKIMASLTFQTFQLSVQEMIALLFLLSLSNDLEATDLETSDQQRSPDNLLRNIIEEGET